MSKLSEIKPSEKPLIIDLVRAAGVNVSDWANFKGGEKKAASNPDYCYEWAFVEPKKVVVLNLWYPRMRDPNGTIVQNLNYRDVAGLQEQHPNRAVWKKRAMKADRAIQRAYGDKLPIRVIVGDGKMRDIHNPNSKSSQVEKRLLDPVPWAVTAYDFGTGQCTVTRGAPVDPSPVDPFVDQFSIQEEAQLQPERRTVSGEAFKRNREIRRRALERAAGKCERCAQPGFTMINEKIYLETHHVVPLAEGGADSEGNVVALCPNDHREAHYGANSKEIRRELLDRLRNL